MTLTDAQKGISLQLLCAFVLASPLRITASVLTNRQPGGGGVSGAALTARDAASPVSVPAGPCQHPVGPCAHGAQRCTRQHAARGATPTAGFM